MKFGRKKHHKVRWAREQPTEHMSFISTSVSVIPTTTLEYWNIGQVDIPDEPEEDQEAGAANPSGLRGGIAKQFTAQPGIRYERIVGDFTVSVKQTTSWPEGLAAAQHILVRAGLCIMKCNELGNFLDEDQWRLGMDSPIGPNLSLQAQVGAAQERRWLWRRSWILQNFAAQISNVGAPVNTGTYMGDTFMQEQPGVTAWTGAAGQYNQGFSCNNRYQSALLGAHLDIKPRATAVSNRERLAWRIWAVDMNADVQGLVPTGFLLGVHRNVRTLVSRGRAYQSR